MEISAAALSFLILAAALGSEAQGSPVHGSHGHEPNMALSVLGPSIHREEGHVHRPADCCLTYTQRKIRCVFMENYFVTTSGCSRAAVIFITKKGQKVCADPNDGEVQKCMTSLRQRSMTDRVILVEKGY